tara:strand:- start:90 stop:395 length:306 start_codon:yes stop_codon:yes gene_type:complete
MRTPFHNLRRHEWCRAKTARHRSQRAIPVSIVAFKRLRPREAQIAELQITAVIEKHVAWLDIAMNNRGRLSMQPIQGPSELHGVAKKVGVRVVLPLPNRFP